MADEFMKNKGDIQTKTISTISLKIRVDDINFMQPPSSYKGTDEKQSSLSWILFPRSSGFNGIGSSSELGNIPGIDYSVSITRVSKMLLNSPILQVKQLSMFIKVILYGYLL
jgi:hypothetical protein